MLQPRFFFELIILNPIAFQGEGKRDISEIPGIFEIPGI